jgi:hypothetical protein
MSILIKKKKLAKGWKKLYIMHKERMVATICENGKATVYSRSFMPYNLYFEAGEDIDTRINNLNNFYYWCASRVLTLDRKYAKEIINSIGARQATTDKDRAAISISYHGLSMTDVYWIRGYREKISFSQISLYSHSLSDAFMDISLRGRQITAQNAEMIMSRDAAGDVGTPGVSPKAWVREDDGFYLFKDGDERDVTAELTASKIVACFDVEHVSYSSAVFEDLHVSKCKIITSEERGIVPFEFIDVYCTNRDMDKMAFVLKTDPYAYYMMNIMDYLIGNTDRHWGNWGFWVDHTTNKPISMYPLMDFNRSFTAYETIEGARCQTTEKGQSQMAAAIEAVQVVGLNQIADVRPEWFDGDSEREIMFFRRLAVLKEADKTRLNEGRGAE